MNGYEMLHKAWNSKGEMPFCVPRSSIIFQGHTVQNITDFDPNWAFPDYRPVAAFKSLRFALFLNVCLLNIEENTSMCLRCRHLWYNCLWVLTVPQWCNTVKNILVNIGSSNGLLSDESKSLSVPNVDLSSLQYIFNKDIYKHKFH